MSRTATKINVTGMTLDVELINNIYGRVHCEPKLYRLIDDLLSATDPQARFTPAFRRGTWDGRRRLMKPNHAFPVGLVPHVIEYAKELGVPTKVFDNRDKVKVPTKVPTEVAGIQLRDYQVEIVKNALHNKVMGVPFPRGILSAATNAGKSLMAAAICQALGNNTPVLFLVPKVEIFDQIVRWYKEYFDQPIGMYTPKVSKFENLTVAMITTMYARRKSEEVKTMLRYFKCLIVDEAHHASADSWADIIGSSNAFYKFGLSGTALQLDDYRNLRLIGLLGPVLGEITNKELVELGVSAKPNVVMLKYISDDISKEPSIVEVQKQINLIKIQSGVRMFNDPLSEPRLRELNRMLYTSVYRHGISTNLGRVKRLKEVLKGHDDEQVLIVVNKLKHGKYMKTLLDNWGIDCTFVSGRSSPERRVRVKRRFESGKIRVLIATMIYKEGVDVPSIDVLVVAMAEKAPVAILQTFGRGLRKRKGKEYVPVYDFYDNGHPKLLEHTKERILIYKRQGFVPKVI